MSAIELENVYAGYGKSEILHGVNLEIPAGKITTLIGSNGSGKSTLLRAVLGFVPLSGGDIRLGGVSVKAMSSSEQYTRAYYNPKGNYFAV